MNDTLLPCPHCGGKGQFELDEYWDSSRVICDSCSAETGEAEGMAAISRWNRRTEQPTLQGAMPISDEVEKTLRYALIDRKMFYFEDGARYGLDSDTIARFVSECDAALDWLQRQRPTQEEGTHE